jgi:hypothetical protein
MSKTGKSPVVQPGHSVVGSIGEDRLAINGPRARLQREFAEREGQARDGAAAERRSAREWLLLSLLPKRPMQHLSARAHCQGLLGKLFGNSKAVAVARERQEGRVAPVLKRSR